MPRCLTSAKCLKSIGNPFIQIPQHPMSSRRRSIEASKHRSIGMSNMSSPCHRHVLLFHHLRHLHLWFLVLPACWLNVSGLWQWKNVKKKKTACILLQYPTVLSICPTVPCRVPCSILHYLKLSPWTSCWKVKSMPKEPLARDLGQKMWKHVRSQNYVSGT